jgi:hypothetical protein
MGEDSHCTATAFTTNSPQQCLTRMTQHNCVDALRLGPADAASLMFVTNRVPHESWQARVKSIACIELACFLTSLVLGRRHKFVAPVLATGCSTWYSDCRQGTQFTCRASCKLTTCHATAAITYSLCCATLAAAWAKTAWRTRKCKHSSATSHRVMHSLSAADVGGAQSTALQRGDKNGIFLALDELFVLYFASCSCYGCPGCSPISMVPTGYIWGRCAESAPGVSMGASDALVIV